MKLIGKSGTLTQHSNCYPHKQAEIVVTGNMQLISKSGTLTQHSNCYSHKQAEITWGQYKLNSKEGTKNSRADGKC